MLLFQLNLFFSLILVIFLFSRFFGKLGLLYLIIIFFFNYIMLLYFFIKYIYILNLEVYIPINSWFNLISLSLLWEFCIDWFNLNTTLLIYFISFIIIIYSLKYFWNYPFLIRFIIYLLLFNFFMLLLIYSNNQIIIFLGWEGVGFCSFLLIGFYSSRLSAINASLKAIFYNKIGDIFFVYFSCYYFILFYSLNFVDLITFFNKIYYIFLLCIFAKSAQFIFYGWLLDAMEGPTPVSALIHAATLVTLGVFYLIKLSFFLININLIIIFLFFFCSLTSIYSGVLGTIEFDIKKIIAYSTVSQMSLLFLFSICVYDWITLFYLITHGFFKSLLFLISGLIIVYNNNSQDIRNINHISCSLTTLILLSGLLSLSGFPFLSGFFAKDLALELTIYSLFNYGLLFSYYVSCIFTIIYSSRLFFFYKKKINGRIVKDSINPIIYTLLTLFILSLIFGYFFITTEHFFPIIIYLTLKLVPIIIIPIGIIIGINSDFSKVWIINHFLYIYYSSFIKQYIIIFHFYMEKNYYILISYISNYFTILDVKKFSLLIFFYIPVIFIFIWCILILSLLY